MGENSQPVEAGRGQTRGRREGRCGNYPPGRGLRSEINRKLQDEVSLLINKGKGGERCGTSAKNVHLCFTDEMAQIEEECENSEGETTRDTCGAPKQFSV